MLNDENEPTESGGDVIEQQTPETLELSERDRIAQQYEQSLVDSGEIEAAAEEPEQPTQEIEQQPEQVQRFKVKVDGNEEEVTQEDLIRTYQKNRAADLRLQQATELRQQVEAERAALEQLKQQPAQPAKNSEITELLERRREALEMGEWEEFDRLDDEIAQQRVKQYQPYIDTEQLLTQATQRTRQQMEYEAALTSFREKNEVIFSDPVLQNLAMQTFTNFCAESKTYSEAFGKTEAAMKNWMNRIAPPGNAAMTDRQARKNSIPANMGRVSARTAPPPAEREESASEIIANMRKSRGLPV